MTLWMTCLSYLHRNIYCTRPKNPVPHQILSFINYSEIYIVHGQVSQNLVLTLFYYMIKSHSRTALLKIKSKIFASKKNDVPMCKTFVVPLDWVEMVVSVSVLLASELTSMYSELLWFCDDVVDVSAYCSRDLVVNQLVSGLKYRINRIPPKMTL